MEFIKEYWESQARAHQQDHAASWGDLFAIRLEISTIGKHIEPGKTVLDVGCANGFAVFRQAEMKPTARFTGIDYADAMIEHANRAKLERGLSDDRVSFRVGSILDLPFDRGAFDVVYTTRVLINLPTWEQQIQAIKQCLRVAKHGGKVIFSEAFWEPLCRLNSIRGILGLPMLAEHDFNRYLKKSRLDEWLTREGLAFQVEEFSSIYYLGSRCVREFVEQTDINQGTYELPLNRMFFELEQEHSAMGLSVQQAYVISI